MAYNYFPNFYPQQMQSPVPQMPQQASQQAQSSGIIPAPDEEFARNYPVAYGASVTFRDERIPYLYTKTMGFSQMDRPKFEKFKLVKEEGEDPVVPTQPSEPAKDFTEDIEKLKNDLVNSKVDIDNLKADVDDLKGELEDALMSITLLKKKLSGSSKKVTE